MNMHTGKYKRAKMNKKKERNGKDQLIVLSPIDHRSWSLYVYDYTKQVEKHSNCKHVRSLKMNYICNGDYTQNKKNQ